MSKLHVLILVAAATLAACKKKEDSSPSAGSASTTGSAGGSAATGSATPDPGPPASCQDAAKNYAKVLADDPSSVLGGAEPGQKSLMKYSYEEACDMGWPEPTKSCVAKAQSSGDARKCFDSAALEQLDAMTKAELADMAKNKAANEAAKAGSGSSAR